MSRLLPYFGYLRPVWIAFSGAIFAALIYGVSTGFGLPFMTQLVFPRIFGSGTEPLTTLQVLTIASLLPAIFFVRGLSGFINVYLINLCGVRVLEQIRMDIFEKLQRLHLAFFTKRSSGDLISRTMADTTLIQQTLTTVANDLVKQPVTFIGALAYLVYLSLEAEGMIYIFLCLALIPLTVFPVRYYGRRLQHRAAQTQAQMGSVTDRLSQNLGAVREIRAFGLEQQETEHFRRLVRSLFGFQMKVVKYNQALSPTVEFIAAFGLSLSFVFAYREGLELTSFITIFMALYLSYEPIKKMGMINNELRKGLAALDRLESVLNAPVEIEDPADPVPVDRLRGRIEFEDVSFAYEDTPVLHHVDLTLEAGTVCALVGPSGAGKSTFASLVPRFYDPTSGTIRIDGIDLRSMRLADLRRNIAVVSQEPALFNVSIFENILIGRPGASPTEVEEAARQAFAHDFISSFPEGYDTVVGERGARLSGGQRQRLALARVFLRNAPILILDEATSALDAESEEMIQLALRRLVVGKTVLIIAHRFSTIRDTSRILVFEAGRIIAQGTHPELLESCPLYRSLYERQR
ncbi:MAG: ABC transporter ATP-binding protein [Puniceicoccaceae bacterium]|nr:MAG: ABC transporter ATP-binding protein [Puniceicoccaceae bacterium]